MTQTLIDHYSFVHAEQQSWGMSAHKHLLPIQACIAELRPKSIIEFGCGKSQLHKQLRYGGARYYRYDPAIPGLQTLPEEDVDFLINTDVLEHIPLEQLPTVLKSMRDLTAYAYFYICTRPATLILPNGENAHCTLISPEQWLQQIQVFYPEARLIHQDPREGCVIMTWDSLQAGVVAGLEEYKITAEEYQAKLRPWYKKLERAYRRNRNRLLGRQRHQRR